MATTSILNIIRHYLTANTNTAVVVFDPHGEELADVVVQMRELADNDRLLYIDLAPSLRQKNRISFNPFDCKDKSEDSLSTLSKQLTGAIGQLFELGITEQMRNVLVPCISVLLHRDGSTLNDLYRFMDASENADLVEYGQTKIPNPVHRQFFKKDFIDSKSYTESKTALRRRLFSLIDDTTVRAFLCQDSTFDLEHALESGKLIVLNGRKGAVDDDAIRVIGQLLTAYISSYAVRRYQSGENQKNHGKKSKISRKRIHLILDECQYFTSPETKKILAESRKFRLHLTLATQTFEQLASKAERSVIDMVIANVGVFHIGAISGTSATKLAKVMPVPEKEFNEQPNLGFYIYERGQRPLKCVIPFVANEETNPYAMKPEQWERLQAQQWETYYQPIEIAQESERELTEGSSLIQPPTPPQSSKTKFGSLPSMDTIRAANQRRKAASLDET